MSSFLAKPARLLLIPTLPDLLFAALLAALFSQPASWQSLFADGDTGWHIRTGAWILQSRAVPHQDLFSFSRPAEPWFAWEWLSDVVFAVCFRVHGLAAIAAFTAAVVCLSGVLLLTALLRRGVGLWIAAGATLAVVSASSVHYLARPHVFSLLGFTVALWILAEDRRRPTRRVWILVPLAALWANLHGGFAGWLATLGFLLAVTAAQRDWPALRRYGALTFLSAAATLVNPYGWQLHRHIADYLRSSWILNHVQEFQSPSIRSENMLVFAALLLGGAALASRALARRDWFEGGLVLLWGFAALRSARHIPLYAIAAAPVVAAECAAWCASRAAGARSESPARVLWQVGVDFGRTARLSLWALLLGGLIVASSLPSARLVDFPASSFPVAAATRYQAVLAPPHGAPRILTSDQWADYLIFRFYPLQRVFFDGRSDFYGPELGADYETLRSAAPDFPEVLARYGFDVALLPAGWPLARLLERDPDWQRIARDPVSELLVRRRELKRNSTPADAISVGG
ncbi:MAG TPA: hypothetical protein VGF16_21410 [Bryobacteraceae bacterium]|jgi:hypothetical protein